MDVKDFVANVIEQVNSAVSESDSILRKPDRSSPLEGVSYVYEGDGVHGWATNIEFDIAVTVTESEKGGAKLSVPGIGSLGGDKNNSSETTSRVKFRVPISHVTQK